MPKQIFHKRQKEKWANSTQEVMQICYPHTLQQSTYKHTRTHTHAHTPSKKHMKPQADKLRTAKRKTGQYEHKINML